MAHKEQWDFCKKVKSRFSEHFTNSRVLDNGSFDVNGNEEFLFADCEFYGLDLAPGDGVDIVCPAQDHNAPNDYYDTIISCECWEHNPYYKESIVNCVRMLKPGGLFLFTCATTGRPPHGVGYLEEGCSKEYKDWKSLPNTYIEGWDHDYYRNVTESDIRSAIDIGDIFKEYEFEINSDHHDLYFWGIKK